MPSKAEENLPATNEGYGTREYWEQRYTNEAPDTTFDWFLTPSYLIPIIREQTQDIGTSARVLMLGCGNSALSEAMYEAGWKNIVNIDYSEKVIQQMSERHADKPEMRWQVMDVLDLQFEKESFDLIIDKGTMDAMLTTKGDPWNPPEKDVIACTKEVSEALRVLKKSTTSKFMYFTFGQPHFRRRYLEGREGSNLTVQEIGPPEGFAYHMFILSCGD
ncbi:S-adenosyl-L-methionine-dependent methyltransferase [Kockovaella imperatae]|uniref:S-adenosyl-L-methionine-dependent methyltransferase n=1 Tax=Kockovaella imperatae TaxID=4999 RepID=A0A1Y1ULD2_9TREE|nr:S-adenosyl-L-methionine-dependent methyltransferase [Kockovaella imperatae]ORX38853.1 S-adenosyl-L-methionine-dependent methyltransferase [Kockovaella imperatae]